MLNVSKQGGKQKANFKLVFRLWLPIMVVLFLFFVSLAMCVSISRYGIEAREGKPTYRSDSEVICTSYYSKLNPLEDGEVTITQSLFIFLTLIT